MRGTSSRLVLAVLTTWLAAAGPALAQAQAPAAAPAAAAAPTAGALSNAKLPAPEFQQLQGNVQTVETLIKTENELALEKARRDRIQAGLEHPSPLKSQLKAKGLPSLHVEVESISGTPGALRAVLSGNGARYEGVTAGAEVQMCRVEVIRNRCVVLVPSTAKGKPQQCPTACWTGIQPQPVAGLAGAGQALPGGPLPMPPGLPQQAGVQAGASAGLPAAR